MVSRWALRIWFVVFGELEMCKLASFPGAHSSLYRIPAKDGMVVFAVLTFSTSKFLVGTMTHIIYAASWVKLRAGFSLDEALSC
jgi:hypothetical protein